MAGKVDPTLAAACVDLYQATYTGADLKAINNAYTSSVSFTVGELNSLLEGRDDKEIIKIMPGIYTPAFASKYGTTAGRLTIFLYPNPQLATEGDDPPPVPPEPGDDPLNLGNGEP